MEGTNFKILKVTDPETKESVDMYVRYNWNYTAEESDIEIVEHHIIEHSKTPMPNWFEKRMLEDAIWEEGDVFHSDEKEND
jgi:hypothetical protein